MTHQVICMWSGPRNLSTAMMRSFGNRADTYVWDEPFFAPWLAATGKAHPGREETLARHEINPETVAAQCLEAPPGGETIYFQKQMPHHMLPAFRLTWTRSCQHFFLIRRPERVIASYVKARSEFDFDDIGFGPLVRFYDLLKTYGRAIPILDCDDILADPRSMLSGLCAALNISFDDNMLSWPAGSRDTDGAWAPWWYKSVESSTGFSPPPENLPDLPEMYQAILKKCQPLYEGLYEKRLRPV